MAPEIMSQYFYYISCLMKRLLKLANDNSYRKRPTAATIALHRVFTIAFQVAEHEFITPTTFKGGSLEALERESNCNIQSYQSKSIVYIK